MMITMMATMTIMITMKMTAMNPSKVTMVEVRMMEKRRVVVVVVAGRVMERLSFRLYNHNIKCKEKNMLEIAQ
jgi:hypothetical protein